MKEKTNRQLEQYKAHIRDTRTNELENVYYYYVKVYEESQKTQN